MSPRDDITVTIRAVDRATLMGLLMDADGHLSGAAYNEVTGEVFAPPCPLCGMNRDAEDHQPWCQDREPAETPGEPVSDG